MNLFLVMVVQPEVYFSRWRLMTSEMHIWKNSDGGRLHLKFRKIVAISLLFDQSSPKLVGILLL